MGGLKLEISCFLVAVADFNILRSVSRPPSGRTTVLGAAKLKYSFYIIFNVYIKKYIITKPKINKLLLF